ncbi:Uncharacterised protein [Escherichia coli]|uniref:Uncharacterized protein n=1 Tax=Escherichia coli TaxID=562 RepID=A0A377CEV6_ECOLX|nr:Uncharacterised protein [Escherichia coli]
MKQIEDLTREAMGFSENAVTRSMSLTRRSIAVTKAAENCRSGNSKRLSISCWLPVAGCWYCWWLAAVAESGTPAVNTSRRGDESCTATGAGP